MKFSYINLQQASLPFAVIGSNTMIEVDGRKVRARQYPWGVVEGICFCSCIGFLINRLKI